LKVIEITVGAGRVVNHPYESYSNLKPSISLKAEIGEGEDWEQCLKELQAKAERLIEDHKQNLLKSIIDIEDMKRAQREAADLERQINNAQQKLDRLRETAQAGMPAIEQDMQPLDIEF